MARIVLLGLSAVAVAALSGAVAGRKGRSPVAWFFLGLLFPFGALIVALFMSAKEE